MRKFCPLSGCVLHKSIFEILIKQQAIRRTQGTAGCVLHKSIFEILIKQPDYLLHVDYQQNKEIIRIKKRRRFYRLRFCFYQIIYPQ